MLVLPVLGFPICRIIVLVLMDLFLVFNLPSTSKLNTSLEIKTALLTLGLHIGHTPYYFRQMLSYSHFQAKLFDQSAF